MGVALPVTAQWPRTKLWHWCHAPTPSPGKIGQRALKQAKGARRLECLAWTLDPIVSARAFDEQIHPPELSRRSFMEWLPSECRNQCEGAAVAGRGRCACQVECHAADVFHQLRNIFEDPVIDALEDIAYLRAGVVETGQEGIVDMPAAVGFRFAECAVQREVESDISKTLERGRHGHNGTLNKNSAMARIGHQLLVSRQPTGQLALRRLPCSLPPGQYGFRDKDVDATV